MSVFCAKKIQKATDVGGLLRKTRESLGLNLQQTQKMSGLNHEYLSAIERQDMTDLPESKAHIIAYVKRYAICLGLNPKTLSKQFCLQTGLDRQNIKHPNKGLKIKKMNSLFFISRKIFLFFTISAFILYLGRGINGILQPPKLEIYSPEEGVVITENSIFVRGKTEKEIHLTINESPIIIDNNGFFEKNINLSNGLNTITISATKKHGKTTRLTRHIIVKKHN